MIIRAPRPDGNFYILDKKISEDKRLSWGARGLLVFLLGKPDHWQVSPAALVSATAGSGKPAGRDAVYGLLGELRETGYLTRVQLRGADGLLGAVNYMVSEAPLEPQTEKPETVQPLTGLPYPANPIQVSIERAVNIEKKKESARAKSSPIPKILFDETTGHFTGPVCDHLARWTTAFPATNVAAEILRAEVWVLANPTKRKADYLRFLTSWLDRSQRDATKTTTTGEQRNAKPQSIHDRRAEFAAGIFAAAEDAIRH